MRRFSGIIKHIFLFYFNFLSQFRELFENHITSGEGYNEHLQPQNCRYILIISIGFFAVSRRQKSWNTSWRLTHSFCS